MLVILKILPILAATMFLQQEPLGEYWGTAEEEAKYYKLVDIPLPKELAIEAGSFEVMPDKKRLAIGTRRGDIFWPMERLMSIPSQSFINSPVGWTKCLGWLTATDRSWSVSYTHLTLPTKRIV